MPGLSLPTAEKDQMVLLRLLLDLMLGVVFFHFKSMPFIEI